MPDLLPAMAPATSRLSIDPLDPWFCYADATTGDQCTRQATDRGLCDVHTEVLHRWPPDPDRARLLEAP